MVFKNLNLHIQRRQRRIILYLTIFLLALLVLVFWWVFFHLKDPFSINFILCRTQYGPCSDSQEKAFSDFLGENLIFVNSGEVKDTALSLTGMRDVQIRKILPGILMIKLTQVKPQVALEVGKGFGSDVGHFLLLSLDGEVVGQTISTSLPKLSIPDLSQINDLSKTQKETLQKTLLILVLIGQTGQNPYGFLAQEELSVRVDGLDVIFPTDKDPQVLVGSLQFIMSRFTIEGKKPVKIDLRFKNPVVTF